MQHNYTKLFLLIYSVFISSFIKVNAQAVLYSEDFNGETHSWILNTADVQSSAFPADNVKNYWIVNDLYEGGGGGFQCGFINASYQVENTLSQPAQINGSPNSKYLHITAFGGPLNASFLGVNPFVCVMAQNYFSKMTTDISTIGYDDVSFNFWWMGKGETAAYMQLYYSTDAGSTWNLVYPDNIHYFTQNEGWKEESISISEFGNNQTLRFGFRFTNNLGQQFPGEFFTGYSIDDVEIIASGVAIPNQITTGSISPLQYCSGESVTVDYTATGNYNAGNVFTAQLSNENGSFANPVNIGTLASTTSGTINATIPIGAIGGSGYRIRVVSSNPPTSGSDNSSNITISPIQSQTISVTPSGPINICQGASVTLVAEQGFNNYAWNGGDAGNTVSIVVDEPGNYIVTAENSDGCSTASSESIEVILIETPVINVTPESPVYVCEGLSVTLVAESGFSNYAWNEGNAGNTQSITVSESGTYIVTAETNDANCLASSAPIEVAVLGIPVASFNYSQTEGDYTIAFENTSQYGVTFNWTFTPGNTSTQENPSFTYPFDGVYPVRLIVSNDCGSDTITVNINVLKLSTGMNPSISSWNVYPNPFSDNITIKPMNNMNENTKINLINALGQSIQEMNYYSGNQDVVNFSTKNLSNGIYFIQILTSQGNLTYKVIKQ